MISLSTHHVALDDRIAVAVRLIDETHGATTSSISREARGLAVLLLFSAYENLMRTATRTVLEAAAGSRISNKHLRPGFKVFALATAAGSLRDMSRGRMYSQGLPKIVDLASSTDWRANTVDTELFPDDGSFMKTTQVVLWCRLFQLPHPGSVLRRTWNSLDAVVAERNGIAHGGLTPGEVGRRYAEPEIRALITNWRDDWSDFLDVVEARGAQRDFYRSPR